MASLGCGINSIMEKVEDIKLIIQKYSMVAGALNTNFPLVAAQLTIQVAGVSDLFKGIQDTVKASSLYKDIQDAYKTVKSGYDAVVEIKEKLDEVAQDYKDVVSNIEGIIQDIQDLTLGIDISFIELELVKLGVNPGEILNRLKNGETLDQVLGELKDGLSDRAKAAIEQLQQPLSISFDTACQKLPNVVVQYVRNTSTGNLEQVVITRPAEPQITTPSQPETQERADRTTSIPAPPIEVLEASFKNIKDGKYNFKYFCDGHDVPRFYHPFEKEFSTVAAALLAKNKNFTSQNIEYNLNCIGFYILKPFKTKYPGLIVTSGWRPTKFINPSQAGGKTGVLSAHAIGCAFDCQFPFLGDSWKGAHPIDWLKSHLQNLSVTVGGKRVGRFAIVKEANASTKPTNVVWHIEGYFVYPGLNTPGKIRYAETRLVE